MKRTYNGTRIACYAGYFVQAIINNLSPLLFIVYQSEFEISYGLISWLVMINFGTQLVVDVLAIRFVDKIGYRKCICGAHILAAIGLSLLGVLPRAMGAPFLGLVIPTVIYALGSGLIEVLVSPIVESLPSDEKAASMSLLHSFYCWGQVLVVLCTTLLLRQFGQVNWIFIPMIWALIPAINFFNFLTAPIIEPESGEEATSIKSLFSSKFFLIAMILMLCAGASEQAMSQWSSLFAETSLGVSKVLGDLLGPCMFAVLMGTGRLLYGIFGKKLNLKFALQISAALCVASYLITAFVPVPFVSLLGCGLCGFAVSLMWPGIFSLSAKVFRGSTAMFALLAVFGDLGCAFGPWFAGVLSDFAQKSAAIGMDGLKFGLAIAAVFPLVMMILLRQMKINKEKKENGNAI